jgi:hypothetical protein
MFVRRGVRPIEDAKEQGFMSICFLADKTTVLKHMTETNAPIVVVSLFVPANTFASA